MQDQKNLLRLASQVPLVQCAEYYPELPISRISIDNYEAACTAVRYLSGLGHQRIALISSSNNDTSTIERMKGFNDTLRELGLAARVDYIQYADANYSSQSGFEATQKLLELDDRPTAIFCISDMIALGAIRAAARKKLRVPEDLSVVGFDNIELSSMFYPSITTINQPCYEMGVLATKQLMDAIGSFEHWNPREIFVEHTLVERESSGTYGAL
jgi:LacI family repressor for deo operon, udp, cdd, tsx, nupC, and nupG